jgi:parallel beta-helix repeat protein
MMLAALATAGDVCQAQAPAREVASIASLAALPQPADGQIVAVAGFYVADDGGGGRFRFSAGSTEAHDGGMIVAPAAPDPSQGLAKFLAFKAAARGRWVRIAEQGKVNVRWYGAKGDAVHDDSPAVAAAPVYFYSRKTHGTVVVPAGTYYVAEHFPLYPKVDVVGDGIGRTIVQRRDSTNYLIAGGAGGSMEMSVSHITFDNPQRVMLYRNRSNVTFRDAEFLNGMIRFEDSSYITIDRCTFRDNVGKAAYASSNCDYVTITNSVIRNTAYGGLNLSGHTHSLVANNMIVKDAIAPGVPGYGGIRLPNSAQFNTVSGNVVRNFPRGIFVLSGSSYNTVVANIVDSAASQGMLIESDRNVISQNVVVNPGAECIRLSGASGCVVSGNQLSTTQPTSPALSVTMVAENNQLLNNLIDGPVPLAITPDNAPRNLASGNVTAKLPKMPTTQPSEE